MNVILGNKWTNVCNIILYAGRIRRALAKNWEPLLPPISSFFAHYTGFTTSALLNGDDATEQQLADFKINLPNHIL